VYLVPESDTTPDLRKLLDEFWQDLFEEELSTSIPSEERRPQSRTRAMFDAWFDVEFTESVYDLTPDAPLTQTDVDAADRAEAIGRCAWCDLELEKDTGGFARFMLADRARSWVFAGRVLPLEIDDERVVFCLITPEESDEAHAGDDVLVRVCRSGCEKAVRKVAPEALCRPSSRRLTIP